MPTKAHEFQTLAARAAQDSHAKRLSRRPKARLDVRLGENEQSTLDRNRNALAGRRGGAALEETNGRPTRKSTRASSDRTKRTTSLQLRAIAKAQVAKPRP